MQITGVGSRRVVQVASVIIMIVAIIGELRQELAQMMQIWSDASAFQLCQLYVACFVFGCW